MQNLCCFNHFIGLPELNSEPSPLFKWQKQIFESLERTDEHNQPKPLWIKKATGLGMTEIVLRYIAWKVVTKQYNKHSNVCIVTGPNVDLAIKLIRRFKQLFYTNDITTFDDKERVAELNNVMIEAYPSHKLEGMRSLTNVKFIFFDEADYFGKMWQDESRVVAERYLGKSQPKIVMVSTPKAPGGLFERIESEPDQICMYERLKLPYTIGLRTIYTEEQISLAKQSPSFEREYNLKYIGLIGNVFKDAQIALTTSEEYPIVPNLYAKTVIGIDPGFGPSAFGVLVAQLVDGKIYILFAEEFDRPDFSDMVELVFSLVNRYELVNRIYIDGSFPAFIKSLKKQIGPAEMPDSYQTVIDDFHRRLGKQTTMTLEEAFPNMKVVPISFNKEHKTMLQNVMKVIEGGYIRIHPRFDKLITSLRTASTTNTEYELDKEKTSYDDLFDAFRLAMRYFYQAV
jgi:Terminase RNaseH-like domain